MFGLIVCKSRLYFAFLNLTDNSMNILKTFVTIFALVSTTSVSDNNLLRQSHGTIQGKTTSAQQEEKKCIAEALWYEARGEGLEGMKHVLSVIHNRKESKQYPSTYCKVIKQYKQFSYRNNFPKEKVLDIARKPVGASEEQVKGLVLELAENASKGLFKPLLKPSVMHYHTNDVRPYWKAAFRVEVQHGKHVFLIKK